MKTFLIIIICAILFVALIYVLISLKKRKSSNDKCGCCNGSEQTAEEHKYTVSIEGMSCEHCKARVEDAFNEKPGCCAEVKLEQKCVTVISKQPLTEDEMKQTVQDLGFIYIGYTEE